MCDLNVGIEFTMSSALNQILGFFLIWGQKLAVQLGYLYVFGHGWCMKGTHYNRMDRANN